MTICVGHLITKILRNGPRAHFPFRDTILKEQKDLSVLWTGAPDCPVCHRTMSGVPGPYKGQPATLGKTQAHSAIIHWTVRCVSGATTIQRQQSTAKVSATVNSARQKSELQSQRAPDCPVWHRTVWCRKKTKLQWSTELRTLKIG
jgi:hypothetical protein